MSCHASGTADATPDSRRVQGDTREQRSRLDARQLSTRQPHIVLALYFQAQDPKTRCDMSHRIRVRTAWMGLAVAALAVAVSAQQPPKPGQVTRPAPPDQRSGQASQPMPPDRRQGPTAMPPRVVDETFQSEALGRPMKYRVLLPAGYDRAPHRYPTLYLLHGLMGSYTDWETRSRLFDHVRGLPLIVVMPDGQDAWYTNSAADPNDRFEDYIVRDLVRDVDGKFRTVQARYMRALAGLSMGGYGALKFGLKSPGTFQFIGGFSGTLKVAADPEFGKNMDKKYYDGMQRIFGPPGSKTRLENDIYLLVTKADPARMPFFYVDCGTEDGLLQSNREFVALLTKQKIAYEYRERPGAHNWAYWDNQLPEMLGVMREQMKLGQGR